LFLVGSGGQTEPPEPAVCVVVIVAWRDRLITELRREFNRIQNGTAAVHIKAHSNPIGSGPGHLGSVGLCKMTVAAVIHPLIIGGADVHSVPNYQQTPFFHIGSDNHPGDAGIIDIVIVCHCEKSGRGDVWNAGRMDICVVPWYNFTIVL